MLNESYILLHEERIPCPPSNNYDRPSTVYSVTRESINAGLICVVYIPQHILVVLLPYQRLKESGLTGAVDIVDIHIKLNFQQCRPRS
jgi:hypothetical protein